ncbi:U-box domain-containing protein 52-like [Pyrus communis]|uniref:U-box domain-containing protein 52-like n=1 Tax=Pyrus communis TaxID=23211 RepID=UPI0035C227D2
MGRGNVESREKVTLAIDRDKGSQHAIKWAVDNLVTGGQHVILLHVKQTTPAVSAVSQGEETENVYKKPVDPITKELFLPFRSFCCKKLIKCKEVVVEAADVPKTLINYVISNSIEVLVLGAPTRTGLFKSFKTTTDVPSSVLKGIPDFCTLYVIGKGKISYMQTATTAPPQKAHNQIQKQSSRISENDEQSMRKQHPRGRSSMNHSYDLSPENSDISSVSSGRPSIDHMFPSLYNSVSSGMSSRQSMGSEFDSISSASSYSRHQYIDMSASPYGFSTSSSESGRSWSSSQNVDEVEVEMRRLQLELKQTMDMYNAACKEAVASKHTANRLKSEEQQRLHEARIAEEAALAQIENEKAKCKAAIQVAAAAQMIAELESQKRRLAEMTILGQAEEKKGTEATAYSFRYRKYTIEEIEVATNKFSQDRKIGEGGYGPVYWGELDHTQVAIKILRPDAAHGRSQFQQEIEVLSCIRHPNMVLLLGACPEYGCLVYEYMAKGSLEDCLFQQGNSKTPAIPWQLRFRIAAEIGTALLFLHQTKPEPIVHRDLKPGNILLDHNYVSKISDVGLARLVPPSVQDSVTQYRMTSTAGTFCYIDPEYQQTGMLGTKSDVYSLGVMFLQLITAKSPMGLTHHVERALELGTFAELLDPAVPDWPVEEATNFAKLALQCAEMRRKDRPDLGKVMLPELNRLRALAEDSMPGAGGGGVYSQRHSKSSMSSCDQDVLSDVHQPLSGYES